MGVRFACRIDRLGGGYLPPGLSFFAAGEFGDCDPCELFRASKRTSINPISWNPCSARRDLALRHAAMRCGLGWNQCEKFSLLPGRLM